MEVTVLTFGKIAAITGPGVTVGNATDTDGLRIALETMYPLLKGMKYMIAVDKKMVTQNTNLTEGSAVALMPPFSGG